MVSMFFGQYLLEHGAVNRQALLAALARQRRSNRSVLDLAVDQGLLDPSQRERILFLFRNSDRSLEQICLEDGYLERIQVDELLEAQRAGWLRIGDALVEGGSLTRAQVNAHLEVFRQRQAEVHDQLESAFAGLPEPETVKAFFNLASSYVGRLLGKAVKLVTVEQADAGLAPGRRRYAQHFTGDRELWLAVDIDDRLAAQLAGCLLSSTAELTPEAVQDAVCELVNVVGGNACTCMEMLGHRLRPQPPVVSGPEPPVVPDGPSTRGLVVCEEDTLEVRLYQPDRSAE